MIYFQTITLPQPVTLDFTPSNPGGKTITRDKLQLQIRIDTLTRSIFAQVAGIPNQLRIYGPDDFADAVLDTPEQHAERVLYCLGSGPEEILQALIDGAPLPVFPVRVPRSIENWRAHYIIEKMGLKDLVDEAIRTMSDDAKLLISHAWYGNAALSRNSPSLLALADKLGLTDAHLDHVFIEGRKLNP